MKKSVIAVGIVAILGGGYVGTAWYTGNVIEKNIQAKMVEITKQINEQQQEYQVAINYSDYQKNIFSTKMHLVIKVTDKNNVDFTVFNDDITIHHGPFPLAALSHGHFAPQMAWVDYAMSQEVSPELWQLSGNKPFITGSIAVNYQEYITVNLINSAINKAEFKKGDNVPKVTISAGELTLSNYKKIQDMSLKLKLDNLHVVNDEINLNLKNFLLSATPNKDNSGFDYSYNIDDLSYLFQNNNSHGLKISNMQAKGTLFNFERFDNFNYQTDLLMDLKTEQLSLTDEKNTFDFKKLAVVFTPNQSESNLAYHFSLGDYEYLTADDKDFYKIEIKNIDSHGNLNRTKNSDTITNIDNITISPTNTNSKIEFPIIINKLAVNLQNNLNQTTQKNDGQFKTSMASFSFGQHKLEDYELSLGYAGFVPSIHQIDSDLLSKNKKLTTLLLTNLITSLDVKIGSLTTSSETNDVQINKGKLSLLRNNDKTKTTYTLGFDNVTILNKGHYQDTKFEFDKLTSSGDMNVELNNITNMSSSIKTATTIDKITSTIDVNTATEAPLVIVDKLALNFDYDMEPLQQKMTGKFVSSVSSLQFGRQPLGYGEIDITFKDLNVKKWNNSILFNQDANSANSALNSLISFDKLFWHNDKGDMTFSSHIDFPYQLDFNIANIIYFNSFTSKIEMPWDVMAQLIAQVKNPEASTVTPEQVAGQIDYLQVLLTELKKSPWFVWEKDNRQGLYMDLEYSKNKDEVVVNGKNMSKEIFFNLLH